jgi:glycosyltransferase involved in cell wall biosynthesis
MNRAAPQSAGDGTARISVVICTHNPRKAYLQRTLAALRAQTLPAAKWGFVIVDNASREGVGDGVDLAWHPGARIVREDELGITPARLRGAAETAGEVIVYVDDDNVLDADYLERVEAIAGEWPALGMWGAGKIIPEYEQQPSAALDRQTHMLALRDVERPVWTNNPFDDASIPYGAGLCVRRRVAERFVDEYRSEPLFRSIGRRGSSLLSAEDTLFVIAAHRLGLGWGIFPGLRMFHLIPGSRVQAGYLLELREKMTASNCVAGFLRTGRVANPTDRWTGKAKYWFHALRLVLGGRITDWKFHRADMRGYRAARRILEGRSRGPRSPG